MLSDIRVGPIVSADGTVNPLRASRDGAAVTTDAHGRYTEAVLRGNVYYLSYPATAGPTAYVGAAGGTPLLAVHNPTGSNKALALIYASGLVAVTGSGGTATTNLALWAGASVTPTGTQTSPKSVLTYASGGVGLGFINTALTSSTALNLVLALNYYHWVTTAATEDLGQGMIDLGGLIVLMPGMQAAMGATVVPTSTTWNVSLFWEEIAI